MAGLCLGIDIGSISINTVVMNRERQVLENHYTWCHGRPFDRLQEILAAVLSRHPSREFSVVALTGSGGALAATMLGGAFVNEVVAQSTAAMGLHPEARSVIEMGGEDSKLIMIERGSNGEIRLEDFAMNSMCAAGTGSFLDQQAARMGISIEKEFGELALQSRNPPRIAGRCSVFAKSDMIHLQQIATPVHDIVAALCFAVARNFKSNLARGKEIRKPVVFQGGVAGNAGMVRAFREILGLADGQLLIPQYHASMGAIGAVFSVLDHPASDPGEPGAKLEAGMEILRRSLADGKANSRSLPPLQDPEVRLVKEVSTRLLDGQRRRVYLGLDIGSLSTNVVLIDDEDAVIARRYLPTASRPLEAIRRGLSEISEEVGDRVEVAAVGSTGSGRYLTGDFVGADVIQNEITAQATAAIAWDPTVDTVFEIGGQDSKFISIQDGIVVDFEMNKVCAAGTGSFLEEQAEKLGIAIVEQFGALALEAERPVHLGDRCTVFMESDLNSHQQKGASTRNLVGGLAYSIVYNYIQKVVGTRRVGEHIFFQGGVANNRSVIAAFQAVTGKPITVPPHFDVTGAIGVAMLARKRMREAESAGGVWKTRFKGFDISRVPYTLGRFTCSSCTNQCEIRKVTIQGQKRPLYYGGRCEKWELEERRGRGKNIPNLFEERIRMLEGDFVDSPPVSPAEGEPRKRTTVGIPRALMVYYQQFPFWKAFFEELGVGVMVSRPTDRTLIQRSLEMLTAETCFPVEVVYGHVMDLLDRGADYVFAPFAVSAKADEDNRTANYNCPWVQTYPFLLRAALRGTPAEARLLTPTLHFRYFDGVLRDDLTAFAASAFGARADHVRRALALADDAQSSFEQAVQTRGEEVLQCLPSHLVPAVILGRPYNTGDSALNLSLVEKLMNLNVLPIPLDFLPLARERILDDYYMMYWPNGQRILAAARIVAKDPRLHAVYLGNFRCGPDSFLAHYVREELAGKPYLQLEVDEHSADAGMITRCEAFLDSLRGRFQASPPPAAPGLPQGRRVAARFRAPAAMATGRTLYFPYMADGAYALAAASRSCGVDAHVLPMQDAEDLRLARQHTSAKECFPMICTLGSFLKKIREPGFEPARAAFFMPDHGGPCRFGQYNKLQRIVFDKLGYREVEIVAPSNEDSYAGLSGGHGNRFRLAAIKGIFAVDLLRKLKQERRPYEAQPGSTDELYRRSLDMVVRSVEGGAHDLAAVMQEVSEEFRGQPLLDLPRRPVVLIVGEIFMRDNPFCSAFLADRLEALGAETLMAPFTEWLTYSTLRFGRDSRWRRSWRGVLRAEIQRFFTHRVMRSLRRTVHGLVDLDREVDVETMLDLCGPYVHRDYDGDPPLALGAAAALAPTGISGVANILPFTCLPGTLVAGVSGSFRRDHGNIPWVNIDYDGQEDTSLETRLQAFMHQVGEYAARFPAASASA